MSRLRADQALRTCVIATAPQREAAPKAHYGLSDGQIEPLYEWVADLMDRSVRLGGGPCTGLPWRWGYGLPDCGPLPSLNALNDYRGMIPYHQSPSPYNP